MSMGACSGERETQFVESIIKINCIQDDILLVENMFSDFLFFLFFLFEVKNIRKETCLSFKN